MKRTFAATTLALAMLAANASAASAEPVRIGVLTDMSGPLSATLGQGSVEGARLAVEEFGGKVLGQPVEVLFADHQNKPDVGTAIARKWLEQDGVSLILDLGHSAIALAVQHMVTERNKVIITTGAASSALTGKACSPNGFHWGYDTYQAAVASAKELVRRGGDTWYFVTADYAYGHSLEADTTKAVTAAGGKVLGSVRHPINNMDFSSHLLQAQSSGAKVIGIASAVSDLQNALKQGHEFNVFSDKQRPAPMGILLVDVKSIGLPALQGATFSTVFYWDADERTRELAKRFEKKTQRPPTEPHAMNYSAVLHYLKAIEAAGTTDTKAVLAKMRETKINDATTNNAWIRADGRVMRDIHLASAKRPADAKGDWDLFAIQGTIRAEDAFRPAGESECPLLK